MRTTLLLTAALLILPSPGFSRERCRVSPALGGYDVDCQENGSSNVLNRALDYQMNQKTPLQIMQERQRQNAADEMTRQNYEMQQKLLQLELEKKQLELERLRQQSPEQSTSTNVDAATRYCTVVANGAGHMAEVRGKESWESIEKKLLDALRGQEIPVVLKTHLLETLDAAYHSNVTPSEASTEAERLCLKKMAKLSN